MKKILLFVGSFLCLGIIYAGSPVTNEVVLNSNYTIIHGTATITDSADFTIPSSGRWREVYIGDPATTASVFYRADGSNTSISTYGWWIPAGEWQRIETDNTIYLRLASGASNQAIRYLIIQR